MLERNALLRMGEERRIDAREWIYAFPQQFDSLRQGLVDLVANLFDKSVYQDAPIMRGVYFTSGTQEGRPVDRVMANMAAAFGVTPRVTGAPPTKPKSYFVRDVFQHVVFPDRDVAVRSARAAAQGAHRPLGHGGGGAGRSRRRCWCCRSRRISRTSSWSASRAASSRS